MEGKANIQIGQVNNLEKQKVSLTYYIVGCDNVEDAQSIKYSMDKVAESYGAVIHEDSTIIGEELDKKSKKKSEKIDSELEQQ